MEAIYRYNTSAWPYSEVVFLQLLETGLIRKGPLKDEGLLICQSRLLLMQKMAQIVEQLWGRLSRS